MADTQLIARQLLSDLKRDFGLTNEQAAGVVGNLMHESGGFNSLQEINPTVPGSAGGFGFAQWTGDRRKSFDSYVADQGLDRNSYEANYGFLKHELATDPYERRQFNTVKKAETAAQAAKLVSENYLRPGIPHNESRVRYAEQVLPYASMPVPPGEIPNMVGTLTDTIQPAPPIPVTPMPSTAAMRGMTSPTGGNTALQTAIDQYATRERNRVTPQMPPIQSVQTVATIPSVPQPGLTAPGGVNAVFGNLRQDPATAAALAPRKSLFNGGPGTPASGPVVASIPSLPVPPMSRAPISYAGQEASPGPIGKPPATIAVKSIPMPPQSPRMDPIGSMPSMAGMQASLGRPLSADQMYEGIYPKEPGQFRIGSTDGLGAGVVGGRASTAILTGKVNEFGSPVTEPFHFASRAPTPFMRPPSFPTQFATAPRIAPVPFPPYRAVGSMRATVPMPFTPRPQPQRAPLQIMVQGANPVQPQLKPQQALIAAGNAAVNQSGDYSTGNQAEAKQLIASGNTWRESQSKKK